MRKLALFFLVALVTSCGPMPRPRWACERARRLYPTGQGYMPVCERELAEIPFDCAWFEDENFDGRATFEDVEDYCRTWRRPRRAAVVWEGPEEARTMCIACLRL